MPKLRQIGWMLMAGVLVLASSETVFAGGPDSRQAAGPRDFAELLARFRKMPGLEVTFKEQKRLKLLRELLTSRGRMFFMPPGTLLRQVEAPQAETLLIQGNTVTYGRAQEMQTFDVRQRPQIKPLVESLLWLFAGNQSEIEKAYSVSFDLKGSNGTARRWRLVLTPRNAKLRRLVKHIELMGDGWSVRTIVVREISGDVTTTEITSADPKRHFSAAERARLFGKR